MCSIVLFSAFIVVDNETLCSLSHCHCINSCWNRKSQNVEWKNEKGKSEREKKSLFA